MEVGGHVFKTCQKDIALPKGFEKQHFQKYTFQKPLSLTLRLLWLLDTFSFQFQCPESAAKWFLKGL
jgi:hypothetical protein